MTASRTCSVRYYFRLPNLLGPVTEVAQDAYLIKLLVHPNLLSLTFDVMFDVCFVLSEWFEAACLLFCFSFLSIFFASLPLNFFLTVQFLEV